MKKICSNICLFVRDTFKPITYAYDIGWKIFIRIINWIKNRDIFFFSLFLFHYIYI